MPSSPLARARFRLLDRALSLSWLPSRIDPSATISPLAYIRGSSIHGPVTVEEHARLHRVELSGPITIGRYSSLWGPRIYVDARLTTIDIGNFCSVARDVSVHGYGHDSRRISTHYVGRNLLGQDIEDEIASRGPTTIGHDVWIGAGTHILSGVTIGTGAIVGAGSVVTRDVEPYAIAVGAPASPIRYRFTSEIIERLLASAWWTWSRAEITERAELFLQPVSDGLLDRHL
jgi:virginiamycin A acetyltransferase